MRVGADRARVREEQVRPGWKGRAGRACLLGGWGMRGGRSIVRGVCFGAGGSTYP